MMFDFSTTDAVSLPAEPFTFRHVRDLIEFDGVLLAEYADDAGDPVLLYWCDADLKVNRWIWLPTTREALASFLANEIPLRRLFDTALNRNLCVVDLDGKALSHARWLVPIESLPSDYLPSEDAFFSK